MANDNGRQLTDQDIRALSRFQRVMRIQYCSRLVERDRLTRHGKKVPEVVSYEIDVLHSLVGMPSISRKQLTRNEVGRIADMIEAARRKMEAGPPRHLLVPPAPQMPPAPPALGGSESSSSAVAVPTPAPVVGAIPPVKKKK